MGYRSKSLSVPLLKAVIADLTTRGHPTIDQAADRLGTSIRSLQRHLAQQGLSYSDLVDGVRYQAAQNMLRESAHSIAEVAAALGYRDTSSFSRAFARWSGTGPRAYRRRWAGKGGAGALHGRGALVAPVSARPDLEAPE